MRFPELRLILAAAVLRLVLPMLAQEVTPPASRVIEAAGRVEFLSAATNAWRTATNGLALAPGDRLRTGPQSRAAVRFSDRSLIRLGEATVLEIQPPRHAGSKRFSLREGLLFFFNRERPADVEFETPVSAGAIRGTEFVIEAAAATGATRLTMFEGSVDLTSAGATLGLQSGEQAEVLPGTPPRKTALLTGKRVIQWALYYPAVLNPADLGLTPEEETTLAPVLRPYRDGDVLAAHAAMAALPSGGASIPLFELDEAAEGVRKGKPGRNVQRLVQVVERRTGTVEGPFEFGHADVGQTEVRRLKESLVGSTPRRFESEARL